MKTLLTLLLLLGMGVERATASHPMVQVKRQNDTLTLSLPTPESGWHYSQVSIIVDGMTIALDQVSPNSWQTSTQFDSGEWEATLCSDESCRLLDGDWAVPGKSFAWAALVAVACGAIMNFMPCVLPVIGLKLRAFGEPRKRAAYIGGVMCSFMLLATLSLTIGTGLSQMGFTHYRTALSVICFLMGSHMLGLWHMPSFGVSGEWGPFGMGCLTVALGSSCAVPFIAPVMAYTLTCTPLETYLLFAALGGGFCTPFLLPLSSVPRKLGHYLPVFEKSCAFGLVVVSSWLWTTLPEVHQWPVLALSGGLLGLLVIIPRKMQVTVTTRKFWLHVMTSMLFGVAVSIGLLGLYEADTTDVPVQSYPIDGPRVIFVTAEWCLNCHAMYPTLTDDSVESMIAEYNIPFTILDYTDRPPEVGKFLLDVTDGLRDVPVLLIESPEGIVTILTGVWTTGQVIESLNAAP